MPLPPSERKVVLSYATGKGRIGVRFHRIFPACLYGCNDPVKIAAKPMRIPSIST